MDWKTILTSTVIAAIISGVFAIIQQKNSTTARYVIEQREEWREKIRELADNIFFGNTEAMKKSLIKLKTRINPYGQFYEYKRSKENNKKGKETNINEDYYLNDGHILKVMDKLMLNEDVDKNKKLLVDYLSLLIKFDWERAKIESSINKKQILSIVIEFFAIFLLAFYLSPITKDNIIYLVVFVMIYAFPYILQYSQNSNISVIKKTTSHAINHCLIIELVMYGLFISISGLTNHLLICWSCLICIFSETIKISSFDSKKKMVDDYISALDHLEKSAQK